MSSMINLLKWVFGHPRPSLERTLAYTKAAYRRTEALLQDMERDRTETGTCPCCVFASYGGIGSRFDRLLEKQERREVMIQAMERRLKIRASRR